MHEVEPYNKLATCMRCTCTVELYLHTCSTVHLTYIIVYTFKIIHNSNQPALINFYLLVHEK